MALASFKQVLTVGLYKSGRAQQSKDVCTREPRREHELGLGWPRTGRRITHSDRLGQIAFVVLLSAAQRDGHLSNEYLIDTGTGTGEGTPSRRVLQYRHRYERQTDQDGRSLETVGHAALRYDGSQHRWRALK